MASKTPEGERRGPNGGSSGNAAIANINPQTPAAASGLLEGALDDEGGDDDGDGDDGADTTMKKCDSSSKKKRKKSSKKKKTSRGKKQTTPPTVPVSELFSGQPYPEGEISDYAVKNDNLQRTTAEESRHFAVLADMDDEFLNDYRKAAEVHRQIEDGVRALVGHPGIEPGDALKGGLAFPTGLCINNIAAHSTPNPGAKDVILQQDDVLSVDFGVHVNGRIIDSAFTVAANPVYVNLLAAVKAATNTGLQEAGIDARMDHISGEIQEVMESYELELNGKTVPVKAVRSLTGHNILRYKIHGDKQVPFVKTCTSQRMEEGDVFAIETFGTTGRGHMRDDVVVYGYGRNDTAITAGLFGKSSKALLKTIDEQFGTLVFSKRYLQHIGVKNYHLAMKSLIENDIVEVYGPLVDIPGSHVAQFEHTILLRPNCKEVISRGDDY
ncbi:unnamed protein product [Zymoseptoria tritici ST99CH_3D7]|uniref:Methionine aminopeptidase 2 n=1 Tax=Zymoseptoria tritici (strain ST99CH_3D7) TaxID=1276538 RepID=A0A1X7S370_ZYMT9|nr:unnamed protein product [Zymoseptoria tritici ST99CH_3D7]